MGGVKEQEWSQENKRSRTVEIGNLRCNTLRIQGHPGNANRGSRYLRVHVVCTIFHGAHGEQNAIDDRRLFVRREWACLVMLHSRQEIRPCLDSFPKRDQIVSRLTCFEVTCRIWGVRGIVMSTL
jgi:hypothetical protein